MNHFIESFQHGIGTTGDLPIPLNTVLISSIWVIVLTFVLLKVSWKASRIDTAEEEISRDQPLVGRAIGLVILLLLILPGLISDESSSHSIAPLLLWVVIWIGVPVLSLFFGDIYSIINPLTVLSKNNSQKTHSMYIACILFLGFAWFELVWRKPGNPTHIAIVFLAFFITVFSLTKFQNRSPIEVDPLYVLHYLYSRMKLTNRNKPIGKMIDAVASSTKIKGIEYFHCLMIGAVTYDGLSGTVAWYNQFGTLSLNIFFNTFMFLVCISVVIGLYRFACYFAIRTSKTSHDINFISNQFAHTMLPISFAYHITHYISLLLFEGQTFVYRANDPFGLGWDIFGATELSINYFVSPVGLWTLQVFVTLLGHILAVILAHDLTVKFFGIEDSDKIQYAFLGLTIALTLQALFVLSVP